MQVSLVKTRKKWDNVIPLLYPGDHLAQPEFHRRYVAYPDPNTKFELIGGIVYMMSPAGYQHGRGDLKLSGLIFQYERKTPGVEGAQNTTVILGPNSEPQPDNVLMIRREYGGRVQIRGKKTKYVIGAPELVLEVAHSSRAIDLHEKRNDYRQGGVEEYVVFDVDRESVYWFDLRCDEQLSIRADGILRIRTFPGFWIDTAALMERNVERLADCLDLGMATREHQDFVDLLAKRRRAARKSRGK
jgi:Uma2 family endonuclease